MAKTKKILTTTAAVAAATTGAMVATTAHADTTATSGQTKQSTVSAQDQLSNMQAQHSQAESQMASANAQEMASATSDTNSQVAKLEDQLKANQASQAAKDAPKLASGTKAINKKADQATAKENATYSDTVKSQEAANKQALADAAKNIYTPVQKQQLENKKTSEYNQDKAKLDQEHQTKLNNLKADHDKQATKLNDEIKANQTSAEQAHDQAVQNAKDKLAGQISAAQSKVDQLDAKVKDDQTAVNKASKLVNQAKDQLDSAKQALDDAQKGSQIDYSNDFPKYKVRVRDGEDYVLISSPDPENWHDNNPADQREVTLDSEGRLTGQDAKDAAIFAAKIINYIRDQVGTKHVKVSQDAIDIAIKGGQLFGQPGVSFGDDDVVSTAEQAASGYNHGRIFFSHVEEDAFGKNEKTTMAQIKEQINFDISSYLSEYRSNSDGHRRAIFGNGLWYPLMNSQYVAFNFAGNKGIDMLWYMDLNNQNDIPLGSNSSANDVTALQNTADQAQQTLYNANSALTKAQTRLKNDQSSLETAQANLDSLKKGDATKNIPGVTESPKVKALKDQLASLETSYAADVKAENDAYNKQKSELESKYQKAIDAIKAYPENTDQLKAAQAQKLAQLKKEHEAKLAKIKADAEQQIAALKQQLADSHNDVNQPIIDKINALKAALAAKQDQLNQKLVDLKANDAAEYNALRDKLMPKQVVTGVANGYLTAGGQVVSLSTKSGHSASSEATLPQTGNNSSLAAVILGAVSMMFSFGLMKKREF